MGLGDIFVCWRIFLSCCFPPPIIKMLIEPLQGKTQVQLWMFPSLACAELYLLSFIRWFEVEILIQSLAITFVPWCPCVLGIICLSHFSNYFTTLFLPQNFKHGFNFIQDCWLCSLSPFPLSLFSSIIYSSCPSKVIHLKGEHALSSRYVMVPLH